MPVSGPPLAFLMGGWPPVVLILLAVIVIGGSEAGFSPRLLVPPALPRRSPGRSGPLSSASTEAWAAALALPLTERPDWWLGPGGAGPRFAVLPAGRPGAQPAASRKLERRGPADGRPAGCRGNRLHACWPGRSYLGFPRPPAFPRWRASCSSPPRCSTPPGLACWWGRPGELCLCITFGLLLVWLIYPAVRQLSLAAGLPLLPASRGNRGCS